MSKSTLRDSGTRSPIVPAAAAAAAAGSPAFPERRHTLDGAGDGFPLDSPPRNQQQQQPANTNNNLAAIRQKKIADRENQLRSGVPAVEYKNFCSNEKIYNTLSREIPVCQSHDPIADEQILHDFVDNCVYTTKYSLAPWKLRFFLFRMLWEQFQRLPNFYFLIIGSIQVIPGISPTGQFTTLATLVIVLLFSFLKAGVEDIARYRRDSEINSRTAWVLKSFDDKEWRKVTYADIRVGDLVRVDNIADEHGRKNNEIPCDLMLLTSSEKDGSCYIETANLDGETNLKMRKAHDATVIDPATIIKSSGNLGVTKSRHRPHIIHGLDMADLAVTVAEKYRGMTAESEHPNSVLYRFSGNITHPEFAPDTGINLGPNQTLYRGCSLRKVHWVVGLCIFSGHETKLMNNMSDPPHKASKVERTVNMLMLVVLALQALLCIVGALGTGLQNRTQWYLGESTVANKGLQTFVSFLTFVILTNNFIPISMYVSMEFIKYYQGRLMEQDLCMYYAPKDMPAAAKATDLNEELGQVNFVFCDKTGTLTRNVMHFLKFGVGGEIYGLGTTEIGRAAAKRRGIEIVDERPEKVVMSGDPFWDPRMMENRWVSLANAEEIRQFFMALAICHTVVVDSGKYEAESPDEEALVRAAKRFGYAFIGRTSNEIVLETKNGSHHRVEVLEVLHFNSDRKRMSVVTRLPSGEYVIYSKGAETTMFPRLRESTDFETAERIQNSFAEEGLRPLIVAQKTLEPAFAKEWLSSMKEARSMIGRDDERDAIITDLAIEVECDLRLVGITGVEDKLQDMVPETILALRKAGCSCWMLTGDKRETAINIGFACDFLHNDMYIAELYGYKDSDKDKQRLFNKVREAGRAAARIAAKKLHIDGEKSAAQLEMEATARRGAGLPEDADEDAANFISDPKSPGGVRRAPWAGKSETACVVDGITLAMLLDTEQTKELLFDLAKNCNSVICCRVTPQQKADVVKLMVDFTKKSKNGRNLITLAIGDGANDVPMIQAAHVGVGISGMEGQQAANSADFAIGQFKFLHRLMMIHGRVNYTRLCLVINYFFYKNALLVMTQFWFCIFNLWSGQSLYEQWSLAGWNVVFTSIPVLVVGLLDRDVLDTDKIHDYPQLYQVGTDDVRLNFTDFVGWVTQAVWHSTVCFFCVVFGSNGDAGFLTTEDGKPMGLDGTGVVLYTVLIFVATCKLALHAKSFTAYHWLALGGSVVIWLAFLVVYSAVNPTLSTTLYGVLRNVGFQITSWLYAFVICAICLFPDFMYKYFRNNAFLWCGSVICGGTFRLRAAEAIAIMSNADNIASIRPPKELRRKRGAAAGAAVSAPEEKGGGGDKEKLFRSAGDGLEALHTKQTWLLEFVQQDIEDMFRKFYFGEMKRYKVGFGICAVVSMAVVANFISIRTSVQEVELGGWGLFCIMAWIGFLIVLLAPNGFLKSYIHYIMCFVLVIAFSGMCIANLAGSQRNPSTHPVTNGLIILGIIILMRPPLAHSITYVILNTVLYIIWYQFFTVSQWTVAQFLVRVLELIIVAVTSLIALAASERFTRKVFVSQLMVKRAVKAVTLEEERSMLLLQNVFPAAIVHEVRATKRPLADFSCTFKESTMLNSDIVKFTQFSSTKEPHVVVEMLNRMFTKFDAHAALLGLEKLKTIGDAYLCAGGIPVPDPYHHRKIISMGRRMVRSMFELNKEGLPSLPNLDVHIRVGGATGSIRAGVIGLSKACFDVFGEVSEESELMESSGLPDRMQVTDELYHAAKDYFKFDHIPNKDGKHAYFVVDDGIEPEMGLANTNNNNNNNNHNNNGDDKDDSESLAVTTSGARGPVAVVASPAEGREASPTNNEDEANDANPLDAAFGDIEDDFGADAEGGAEEEGGAGSPSSSSSPTGATPAKKKKRKDRRPRAQPVTNDLHLEDFYKFLEDSNEVRQDIVNEYGKFTGEAHWCDLNFNLPRAEDEFRLYYAKLAESRLMLETIQGFVIFSISALLVGLHLGGVSHWFVITQIVVAVLHLAFVVGWALIQRFVKPGTNDNSGGNNNNGGDKTSDNNNNNNNNNTSVAAGGETQPPAATPTRASIRRRMSMGSGALAGSNSQSLTGVELLEVKHDNIDTWDDGGNDNPDFNDSDEDNDIDPTHPMFNIRNFRETDHPCCSWIRGLAATSGALSFAMPIVLVTAVDVKEIDVVMIFVMLASVVYITSFLHMRLLVKSAVTLVHLAALTGGFFFAVIIRPGGLRQTEDGGNYLAMVLCYMLCVIASYQTEKQIRQSFAVAKRVVYQNMELLSAIELCDKLLRNVLPRSVVSRMIADPTKAIVDEVDEASVLFLYADGVRPHSEEEAEGKETGAIVNEMNNFLFILDCLCMYHHVEKIKTVPYLVVSGCPEPITKHCNRLAALARDVIVFADAYNRLHGSHIRVKAGLHSGKLTAGVLGANKWIYDTFGDTVNFASRLASSSTWGVVQVSDPARRHLEGMCSVIDRGEIELKGKGNQKVFTLDMGTCTVPVAPIVSHMVSALDINFNSFEASDPHTQVSAHSLGSGSYGRPDSPLRNPLAARRASSGANVLESHAADAQMSSSSITPARRK